MIQGCDVSEVEVDGLSFSVRPVSSGVLKLRDAVAAALAESMGKSYPWVVGFFCGNT